MPPYERAIVLAPREPDAVCATIAAVTGVACAIVDANDLHKAKVLGASPASIARASNKRCSITRTATATSKRRSWY